MNLGPMNFPWETLQRSLMAATDILNTSENQTEIRDLLTTTLTNGKKFIQEEETYKKELLILRQELAKEKNKLSPNHLSGDVIEETRANMEAVEIAIDQLIQALDNATRAPPTKGASVRKNLSLNSLLPWLIPLLGILLPHNAWSATPSAISNVTCSLSPNRICSSAT